MIAYGRFHFHSLSNTPRSPTYDFRPMGPLVQVLDAETSKDVLVCDALDEAGWWWWWWLYMIKWLLSWFNRYYLIFVPVQFKLKPKKTLVIPCPIYIHTHIYIYTTYFQIHLQLLETPPTSWCFSGSHCQDFSSQLGFGWETQETPSRQRLTNGGIVWLTFDQMEPDGTRWTCSLKGNMKFDLRNKCICHFA